MKAGILSGGLKRSVRDCISRLRFYNFASSRFYDQAAPVVIAETPYRDFMEKNPIIFT